MIKRFVQKMLRENSEGIREYIKNENTIFIEYFDQDQLDRIKEFADKNINISDKELNSLIGMYGYYEGLKKDWIKFYILTDYMEQYVWDMHDRGEELVYRDFRRDLKQKNEN